MSESRKGGYLPGRSAERWKRVMRHRLGSSDEIEAHKEQVAESLGRRRLLEGIPEFLNLLEQGDPEFTMRLADLQEFAESNDSEGIIAYLDALLGDVGEPTDEYTTMLSAVAGAIILGLSNFELTREELVKAFSYTEGSQKE